MNRSMPFRLVQGMTLVLVGAGMATWNPTGILGTAIGTLAGCVVVVWAILGTERD